MSDMFNKFIDSQFFDRYVETTDIGMTAFGKRLYNVIDLTLCFFMGVVTTVAFAAFSIPFWIIGKTLILLGSD